MVVIVALALSVPIASAELLQLFNSHSECLPIDSVTSCAPYNKGYYINTTALASLYWPDGVMSIQVDDWNSAVANATSGDTSSLSFFGASLGCSKLYSLQYLLTYFCLRDIFIVSAGCNKANGAVVPSIPVCSSTCTEFENSVRQNLIDVSTCPETSDEILVKNREYLSNTNNGCSDFTSLWKNASSNSCVNGVALDSISCGFGGNSYLAAAYCTVYSNDYCCLSVKQNSLNVFGFHEVSVSSQSENRLSTGAIAGISISGIAILTMLVSGVIFLRNRKNTVSSCTKMVDPNDVTAMTPLKLTVADTAKESTRSLLTVVLARRGEIVDEISVEVGDQVEILQEFDDGWAKGRLVATGKVGAVPMACFGK